MWDELRDRIVDCLTAHDTAVLCAVGSDEPGGAVVRYWNQGLTIGCLLPRWIDIAFYIEERPQVLLLIGLSEGHWLHYQGFAQIVTDPECALLRGTLPLAYTDSQIVVQITPRRIDLLRDASSWATRETLELP